MRKILFFILIISSYSIFSQIKAPESKFQLDIGGALNFGYFQFVDLGSGVDVSTELLIYSARFGISFTARYYLSTNFSLGVESGVFYSPLPSNKSALLDLPISAVFRYGDNGEYIEAHAGYYFCTIPLDGFSIGIKGSLSGFYTDITYIINELSYPRCTIGFQFNNIIK